MDQELIATIGAAIVLGGIIVTGQWAMHRDIAALRERVGTVGIRLVDRIGKLETSLVERIARLTVAIEGVRQASMHTSVKRHFMPARHFLDVTSRPALLIVVTALTLCVCAAVPSSSSVLAVSLEELSMSSQLIFEGEVIDMTSTFNANQTSIHTYVTFRVVDLVKGTYNQPEITLRFLGGTVGEISLNVAESTLPELGEEGIYFVESLERFQVNPLYGMDQGHFLILESNSQRVVMTRNQRMVTGLFSDVQPTVSALSNGVALGLSIDEAGTSPSGVTAFEFKQAIRQFSVRQP